MTGRGLTLPGVTYHCQVVAWTISDKLFCISPACSIRCLLLLVESQEVEVMHELEPNCFSLSQPIVTKYTYLLANPTLLLRNEATGWSLWAVDHPALGSIKAHRKSWESPDYVSLGFLPSTIAYREFAQRRRCDSCSSGHCMTIANSVSPWLQASSSSPAGTLDSGVKTQVELWMPLNQMPKPISLLPFSALVTYSFLLFYLASPFRLSKIAARIGQWRSTLDTSTRTTNVHKPHGIWNWFRF